MSKRNIQWPFKFCLSDANIYIIGDMWKKIE